MNYTKILFFAFAFIVLLNEQTYERQTLGNVQNNNTTEQNIFLNVKFRNNWKTLRIGIKMPFFLYGKILVYVLRRLLILYINHYYINEVMSA